MNTLRFQFQFMEPKLWNPPMNLTRTIPFKAQSNRENPPTLPSLANPKITRHSRGDGNTRKLEISSLESKIEPRNELPAKTAEGHPRIVLFGAVTLGLSVLLMGFLDHKALALGPEGPLMEEFWDNMRRYGLYVLTVSTGALYTLFQPIAELLKNPISAILILVIFGGGIFIVSQVVSAMVGLTDFSYDYGY